MSDPSIFIEFLKLGFTGVAAAWVTHLLRERSERKKRKDDWLSSKLVDAYIALSEAIEYPNMPEELADQRKLSLEKAMDTIDLYASEKIKNEANAVVEAYSNGNEWVQYGPLRKLLRDEFRKQMKLEPLTSDPSYIRFHFGKKNANSTAPDGKVSGRA